MVEEVLRCEEECVMRSLRCEEECGVTRSAV